MWGFNKNKKEEQERQKEAEKQAEQLRKIERDQAKLKAEREERKSLPK